MQRAENLATMSNMAQYYAPPTGGGYIPPKSHGLLVPLIVVVLLLVAVAGFGAWAFMERQDYKNNSDQKAAAAAAETKTATEAADALKYAEEAKSPLKTFVGPSDFGSVTVQYPKTWSGYVIEDGNSAPLNAYFHPDVVQDVEKQESIYALRMEIVEDSYDQVLSEFTSAAEQGQATVSPYKLAKVSSVVGSRVDGQLEQNKRGSMVLFPLRNVTLKVWTETDQYISDFNDIILPNLTFSP